MRQKCDTQTDVAVRRLKNSKAPQWPKAVALAVGQRTASRSIIDPMPPLATPLRVYAPQMMSACDTPKRGNPGIFFRSNWHRGIRDTVVAF